MIAYIPPASLAVATGQLPPLPTDGSLLEQVCERLVDAGLAGARWVLFPEGCLPGYPAWIWALRSGIDPQLDALRAEVLASAIHIPSDVTDRLCSVAQRAQVNVVIGVIERDDTDHALAIYSTLLVINLHGQIVGSYRTGLAAEALPGFWTAASGEPAAYEASGICGSGGI